MAKKKATSLKSKKSPWETKLAELFPVAIPRAAEWTDIKDITRVLGLIAHEEAIAVVSPPWKTSAEPLLAVRIEGGYLELFGESGIFASKPVRLEFDHFPQSPESSYFCLITANHPVTSVTDRDSTKKKRGRETLSRQEVDAGAFAFFSTRSNYPQSIHRYEARQSSMSRSEFYKLVRKPKRATDWKPPSF